jgi:tyrosine-specific transport protein
MSQSKPSVIGGSLLITGSCVGAGMLGLPILSGLAGLGPALIMFGIAWVFMTLTGLLLVEANGWFSKQVNLLSIVEYALGPIGKMLCWVTYLFLFYALLVAYTSASGSIVASFFQDFFTSGLPLWAGSLFFVLLFAFVVYRGTRYVDMWNRLLMIGKILFFIVLLCMGLRHVKGSLLTRADFSLSLFSLPILITSFGFHNVVPSLTAYFKNDLKKVKKSILLGSSFALILYLLWEVLVLGIVPLDGAGGLFDTYYQDKEGAQALSRILQSASIQVFAQGLAFFAILTSFLVQALSLVHFLADGFKIKHEKKENVWLCILTLGPPLALSVIYPKLFFSALDFAGGFCATFLFGVLPVLTIWIGRYRKKASSSFKLFGGKPVLISILAFAIFVFGFELLSLFNVVSLTGKG